MNNTHVYQCFLGEHRRSSEKPAGQSVTPDHLIPREDSQFCFPIHPDTADFSYCPSPEVQRTDFRSANIS